MINHDTIYSNSKVQSNYYAETDVSVLKFERSVFEDIIKQFPDIKEDLNKMVQDSMNL
jgi:CRP-like cAMP-binding protein